MKNKEEEEASKHTKTTLQKERRLAVTSVSARLTHFVGRRKKRKKKREILAEGSLEKKEKKDL